MTHPATASTRTSRSLSAISVALLAGVALGYVLRDFQPVAARPGPAAPTGRQVEETPPRGVGESADSAREESVGGGGRLAQAGRDLSIPEIETALKNLANLPDSPQRRRDFGTLLRRWLEADGRGAFAYVNALPEGEMKTQGMALAGEVLGTSDPQFLARQALALPHNRSSGELIRGLAQAWSQADVESAFAWANQLPEGVEKNDALLLIRSQWASQDPAAVSDQIGQLPENSSTAGLISTIAARWGASDPAQAARWAAGLPEAQKALAASGVAGVWAQHDPVAAAGFAAQLPPGETQNETVKAVISSWAPRDPAETAAWVLEFPAGDLREQGVRQVVSAWNSVDPEGARAWAMNLPAGATRDLALKSYAEGIAYWAPEKAAGMTGLIDNRSTQEQSIETVMRSWSQVDPKSAKRWFAGLHVSDELKTRLQITPP